MEGAKELQVRLSQKFIIDLNEIYFYGVETFGIEQAKFTKMRYGNLLKHFHTIIYYFPSVDICQQNQKCIVGLFLIHT